MKPNSPQPLVAESLLRLRRAALEREGTVVSRMPLEVLDRALVRFRFLARREGPEVATLASLGILLARVKTISSGWQFANHSGLYPAKLDAIHSSGELSHN
jgi:hypothetical protein